MKYNEWCFLVEINKAQRVERIRIGLGATSDQVRKIISQKYGVAESSIKSLFKWS